MIAKVTSIILTIVCCACSPIFGQSSQQAPEDNINWFLSGGIGTGTKSLALNAGLYVFPYKRLALAAKYNLSSEVYLWGRPDASESSYSFLIGLADNKFQPRFILLAGYSRVLVVQTYETADQDGSYFESKESITNGIGVNLKAVLSKADHFGLSVNAFGNYNPIQPYAGITINLNIGLLRD
ncbi:hypothetical protein [Fodinibius sp.]|uniref:hypothetical protein n=1 Tax=Fodinibius sp. TaxID=1872440 RepID=UPI002ACEA508|nr:hypothetical protein [Fodinibius sp.]MDZ7659486.1 hypothetical protein [Fodinibius sp.]